MKMTNDRLNKTTGKNRRDFLAATLIGAAASSLAVSSTNAAQDSAVKNSGAKRRGLFPKDAPSADVGYSPGIVAETSKVIFVSGQGPRDLNADMETQMRQTFERIGIVLKESGASFENVVIVRSYFVNMKRDLPIFRKVRKEFLVKPYPASTAIGTTELAVEGLQIEIEAVAVL